MPNNRIDTITCPQNSFINQQECPILVLWSLADCKNHMIKKTLWKSGFAFLPYHYHGNCYIFPWWKYWSLDLELLFTLYFSIHFFPLVNSWSIHIDYNYEIACIQSFQIFQSLQALIFSIRIFTFFACVVWCISTDLLLWCFT